MSMIQQNPILAQIKPEALVKRDSMTSFYIVGFLYIPSSCTVIEFQVIVFIKYFPPSPT
jgi:hypothetical protein